MIYGKTEKVFKLCNRNPDNETVICLDCDILEFWAVKTDKTLPFIPL